MKKILKFISVLSFLLFTISFFLLFLFYASKNQSNNLIYKEMLEEEIINCNLLDYEKSLTLKPDNFSYFDLVLKIDNEKKWKKNLIQNLESYKEEGSFPNRGIYKSKIIFKKNNFLCFSEAMIKPHGDFEDHHMNLFTKNLFEIPSIKVDLIDNHFFGITKFILFRPQSRTFNNEVLLTSILRHIGQLAPRTANINLSYNRSKEKFIFQERLTKEFLEKSDLIEGPIIKGDERFAFKYGKLQNDISKHRISNGNWSKKNSNNFFVSKKSLKILNFASHFYDSDFPDDKVIDYYSSNQNQESSNYFIHLPVFDALMYALSSTHYLSRDERRFYYDSVNKNFLPIYYDGGGEILDHKNNIYEKFKNIKNNWYYATISNIDNTELAYLKTHVIESAYKGSDEAIKLIKNINLSNLKKELTLVNLNLSEKKLSEIIKIVLNNLFSIKNIEKEKIIISKKILSKKIDTNIEKINAAYIFETQFSNVYESCDLFFDNCKNINLNNNEEKLLIQQKLKSSIEKKDYIFMGNYNDFKNKKINVNTSFFNEKIESFNGLKLINFGNNIINYDAKNRSLQIIKKNINGKILIINQSIKDLSIYFTDKTSVVNKDNILDITRDINGLTGCLNFYDSTLRDVNIYVNHSKCEDAVNIVRSEGNLEKIVIQDSISDGLDLDFSDFYIKDIKISNSNGDCLDLSFGIFNIDNGVFFECKDKGVSVGENSILDIKNVKVDKSNIAIASKDFSITNIDNSIISKSHLCFSAYNKKSEFSGGYIKVINSKCSIKNNNELNFKNDHRSKILLKEIN